MTRSAALPRQAGCVRVSCFRGYLNNYREDVLAAIGVFSCVRGEEQSDWPLACHGCHSLIIILDRETNRPLGRQTHGATSLSTGARGRLLHAYGPVRPVSWPGPFSLIFFECANMKPIFRIGVVKWQTIGQYLCLPRGFWASQNYLKIRGVSD